jgi:DNA repair protein RadC
MDPSSRFGWCPQNPGRVNRQLTRRLTDAGRILGIEVLDHVILGDEARYYSFKERGML